MVTRFRVGAPRPHCAMLGANAGGGAQRLCGACRRRTGECGGRGLPGFSVTGSPDASVREARDRVRAAIKNSGVHVSRSEGDGGVVAGRHAEGRVGGSICRWPWRFWLRQNRCRRRSWCRRSSWVNSGSMGTCGRSGGVLPAVIAARQAGYRRAVVPIETVAEAALVEGDGRRWCVEPQGGGGLARG